MNARPEQASRFLALVVLLAAVAPGCSITTPPPGGRLSSSQQILATEAVDRALARVEWPDIKKRKVFIDVAAPSGDQERSYLANTVAAEVAARGAILAPDLKSADTALLVNADAIGLEQNRTFVGLPAVESALIPIGVPEITVYNSEREESYARIELVFADLKKGGVLARTGPLDSETWAQERKYIVIPTHDSNTEQLKNHPR